MRVYVKSGGRQKGYSGHCINLPQNVPDLAGSLPCCPCSIRYDYCDNGQFHVRKQKVEQALYWLVKHNPQYKNVSIKQY